MIILPPVGVEFPDACDMEEEEVVAMVPNITTREYSNKLLLLKQLDALRDLLKKVPVIHK